MKIRATRQSWPPHRYIRRLYRRVLEFRQRLVQDVDIAGDACVYRFRCETVREFNRCLKVFSKEPGTLEWIRTEMKPGQVFFDVGANIGVYSVLAAHQIAPGGRVYAFEPHGPNFARLLANIVRNELEDSVVPCNFALHDRQGYLEFTYDSADPGTSNSQLGDPGLPGTADRKVVELKYAVSIDELIAGGKVQPPHHVKIDVDGNEHLILNGMVKLLGSAAPPLTVQVELNEPHAAESTRMLESCGYRLIAKHYTRSAERRREATGEEPTGGCNGVFRRTA